MPKMSEKSDEFLVFQVINYLYLIEKPYFESIKQP